MSNLQLRIISAVILAAVVLAMTWAGGLPFRLLACLIGALILYEWLAMSAAASNRTNSLLASAGFGVAALAVLIGMPALAVIVALVVAVALTFIHARMVNGGEWAAAGLAYAGFSALSLALLRGGDTPGLVAILFLFAVVWATDIFAYFVGRAIGGPKLAPSISPGKTRSGAIGGAVAGIIAGLILGAMAGLGNLPLLAVAALILSIVAQAGDLFESWVKRRHGVKDSGSMIPGHGGVMDRADGLVAAALALYLLGAAFGGPDSPAAALFSV